MTQRLNNLVQIDVPESDHEIDMTPMLDIVFIMLIFFIVSTSFVRESGVEINRPEAQTAQTKESAGVMVAITANDEVWIDQKLTDQRMVRPTIERMRAEQPDLGVMIQADQQANTGVLITVLDQVKLAGVEQVAVASKSVQR
ncbi:TonB system transport protein ExbD [Oleiphilus messinensis]|uniref:TonB system transport protein ExbD n=1 Tax=Oleiphilus messinensis TaxID=141451 RepID=A0A1Y0IBI5_9GAMM|nr:biopolymer transporter ExbD [Oleiphilus messinensis]ARU57877.1 TonB system transport protein ExbD [Oleiphilus messinensis]